MGMRRRRGDEMPEIIRFFCIIIRMFIRDHGPPHFHAFYQDYQISVDIENGGITGNFPPRALGFVQEWRALHRQELLEIWSKAQTTGQFGKILPLE